MSISSAFLWRFLDDVWDLLPSEDRGLFETYWSAQVQIAAGIEKRVMEVGLGTEVFNVPVYLTERWNKFVMDEDSCDLFQVTDTLAMVGDSSVSLSKQTALYDTLKVTSESGYVAYEQTVSFFDDAPKSLIRDEVIKGTVAVSYGLTQYSEGIDFVVNYAAGTIYALGDGRIPTNEVMTVRYQVGSYLRDIDYTVNQLTGMIRRTDDSRITSGSNVLASYTYNATPTISMGGYSTLLEGDVLYDEAADFSSLLPGRTLTIPSGPNAGEYLINSAISPTSLLLSRPFAETQNSGVVYSINAFPHGIRISKSVASIPYLQDLVDNPTVLMKQGADFEIRDGILSVRSAFPLITTGPSDAHSRRLWAEEVKIDKNTPYRNFGVLIDFFRQNSESYRLALQGLWYTFWTGSTPNNMGRGLHILLGLPYARKAGTVTRLEGEEMDITDERGFTITYVVPDGLDPTKAFGDAVDRFDSLTTGVEIVDRNTNPGFVTSHIGRGGIERFLTSKASRGSGAGTDETRALTLLENHLYVPRILVESITQKIDVPELLTFLDNMKPEWTEFAFSFLSDGEDGLTMVEDLPAPAVAMDLSTTVGNNEWNQVSYYDSYIVHRQSGLTSAIGTQATGNFSDLGADFTALGVDTDSHVIIFSGGYKGIYRVIRRVSSSLLAIEIPDNEIVAASGIDYAVYTREMLLDHDAINFVMEHYSFPGTEFLALPTPPLNVKTDFDFTVTSLRDEDLLNLLLVDLGNVGAEVQSILDSDVTTGELQVTTAPSTGVRDYWICSASLTRSDTGVITDAFAI